MNDLIAKQIDLSCDQTTNTTGPIASKLVKGYAITTKSASTRCRIFRPAGQIRIEGF